MLPERERNGRGRWKGDADDHPGLAEILADYVDRLNRGEEVIPEEVLFDHPDCGEEVLEQLESFIQAAAGEMRIAHDRPLGTLGDYTMRREIGRGGMGVVYEAWEGSLERRVALKVLPPGVAADARSSTRFLREAQIVAKLGHPQIVPVHATGIKDGTPWYAMEYVEGETLAQALRLPEGCREGDGDAVREEGRCRLLRKPGARLRGRCGRPPARALEGHHAPGRKALELDPRPRGAPPHPSLELEDERVAGGGAQGIEVGASIAESSLDGRAG